TLARATCRAVPRPSGRTATRGDRMRGRRKARRLPAHQRPEVLPMAFYVSLAPPGIGTVIRRFGSEEAAIELACDLVARGAKSVEVGSIVQGRLLGKLAGDALRLVCDRRGGLSRGRS